MIIVNQLGFDRFVPPRVPQGILFRRIDFFSIFFEKYSGPRWFGKSVGSSFRRVRVSWFFRTMLWGQMLRRKFWVVFSTSFFLIFPKKFMGPDASDNVLGHPEAPGGHLGTCLGRPGVSGRTFWCLLGGPEGILGGSWAVLGRSWSDLGGSPILDRFLIDFERQKGAQREALCEPKWSQNQSQNKSKSKSIFKSEQIPLKIVLETSWSSLGPILGHLDLARGHLGAILGRLEEPKPLIFLRIFTIFEKSRFYIKMVLLTGLEAILGGLGAILGPLGPNLGRFGHPRAPKREVTRTQEASKTKPKWHRNFDRFLDRFWLDYLEWLRSGGVGSTT